MNKTKFYSLSGALAASSALGAGVQTPGRQNVGRSPNRAEAAAGFATANTSSSDLVDDPGLFAGLCAAFADNVYGFLTGAVVGLIIVAALFHTSW